MNDTLPHFGILLSNAVNKKSFIYTILADCNKEQLALFNGKKGVLFSDLVIDQIIEKEHRHQSVEIAKSQNRALQTFSSGERRKVLLDYCLSQNPDFIILDNPFGHLDQSSRNELSEYMIAVSSRLSIIQLDHQEANLLPCITDKGYVYDNSFEIRPTPNSLQHSTVASLDLPDTLITFDKTFQIIVKFKNVTISYDDQTIVKGITWEVKQGEFWQLIGPNGSGKSTLLSLISGENPKAYGQNIILFDRKKGSGESVWDIKKNIGNFSTSIAELFQRHQTVEQMVLSGFFDSVGLYKKPSGLQMKKAMQWLETIGMSEFKNVSFHKLSLGQQRLVLIVRALIKQPPLLILDEPFEGLDKENCSMIAQLINAVIQTTDITVIYVSHILEESLVPSHIYELEPREGGSIGHLRRFL